MLNRRSEGWAASLQLVHAAVRDRTSAEARDFIRGLSGGQDELYDYLAEEVVGDLSHGHQEFLMRTSILQVVTAQGAAVLADLTPPESASLLEFSERLGLISRRSSASGVYRYHPLVREFLEARLKASVGEAGVRALHEAAGDWARDTDWRAACHHFEAASNIGALHEVIDTSIDTISGQAGYETAAEYLRRHRPAVTTASFEIISSRMDHRNGRNESAVHRARQALALRPDSDAVINNAITMYANVGDHDASWALAKRLAASSTSDLFRGIAKANCLRYEASLDGSLQDLVDVLTDLGELSEASEMPHFAGVSYLNLSLAEQAKGDADAALEHAELAVQELLQTHQGDELASAYLARAVAAARGGRLECGSR